jgi:hypothetical protein
MQLVAMQVAFSCLTTGKPPIRARHEQKKQSRIEAKDEEEAQAAWWQAGIFLRRLLSCF